MSLEQSDHAITKALKNASRPHNDYTMSKSKLWPSVNKAFLQGTIRSTENHNRREVQQTVTQA